MATQWWQYLLTHLGADATQVEMSRSAGVDQTALSRWKRGDRPAPPAVISVARKIGRPPIEALVAAGYLEPSEVAAVVELPAREPTNEELLQMIRTRMEGASGATESRRAEESDTPPILAGRAHSLRVRPVTVPRREAQPTPEFVAVADQRSAARTDSNNPRSQ